MKETINAIYGMFSSHPSYESYLNAIYGSRLIPERILKSGSATIVFWKDGTKTIVKCAKDEESNDYNAFTAALAIKLFGTNSHVKKIIKNKTVIQEKKGKRI